MVDVEELKTRFLNLEFDTKAFEMDVDDVVAAAKLAGETNPRYTDPQHEDFRVLPAFLRVLRQADDCRSTSHRSAAYRWTVAKR